jgi:hypothetical protein
MAVKSSLERLLLPQKESKTGYAPVAEDDDRMESPSSEDLRLPARWRTSSHKATRVLPWILAAIAGILNLVQFTVILASRNPSEMGTFEKGFKYEFGKLQPTAQ